MAIGIRFFYRCPRKHATTSPQPDGASFLPSLSTPFFRAGRETDPERKPPLWRDAKTAGRLTEHLRRRCRRPVGGRETVADGPASKSKRARDAGREGERRRGMTGQVRPVTSWMISAGPDARATGANADAYVSAGATRIRAIGACPSRLLPSVPRLRHRRHSCVAPPPPVPPSPSRCSTQRRVNIRTSLARYNPCNTSEPELGRSLSRETAGENDATFIRASASGPPERCAGRRERKEEK